MACCCGRRRWSPARAAVLLAATSAGRRRRPARSPRWRWRCVEPLLTGGVSAIAGGAAWSTAVFAWDSLAYNVAGLAGPAVVTAVAVLASPAWALVALGVGGGGDRR